MIHTIGISRLFPSKKEDDPGYFMVKKNHSHSFIPQEDFDNLSIKKQEYLKTFIREEDR